MEDKLKNLNDLDTRIKEIKNALEVFDPNKNIRRGIGNDIGGIITIVTKKHLEIKGHRWFGLGHRHTEVKISYDMVDVLTDLLEFKLSDLLTQYKEVSNNK